MSDTAADNDLLTVTMLALPGGPSPPASRFRSWLKSGLRSFGLRCERIHNPQTVEAVVALKARVAELETEVAELKARLRRKRP